MTERLSLSFLAVIILGWFIYTCVTRWRKRDYGTNPRTNEQVSADESTTVTPVSPPADACGSANYGPGSNRGVGHTNHHHHSSTHASSRNNQETCRNSRNNGGASASANHCHSTAAPNNRRTSVSHRTTTNRGSSSTAPTRSASHQARSSSRPAANRTESNFVVVNNNANVSMDGFNSSVDVIDTSDDSRRLRIEAGTPPPSYESVCGDDPPSYQTVVAESKR